MYACDGRAGYRDLCVCGKGMSMTRGNRGDEDRRMCGRYLAGGWDVCGMRGEEVLGAGWGRMDESGGKGKGKGKRKGENKEKGMGDGGYRGSRCKYKWCLGKIV